MKQVPKQIEAQMLIRKPVKQVFEAFIDPEITRHFWFSRGSSKLESGKTVTWEWEWYGISTNALVKEIIPNELIVVDWDEPATTIEFHFESLNEHHTYVIIRESGFSATGDELVTMMLDSTGGFTTLLDGLKAYLEHGIELNLVKDKFPKGLASRLLLAD
jgi:uncharacterized protein YndB with AHSA1/START domain